MVLGLNYAMNLMDMLFHIFRMCCFNFFQAPAARALDFAASTRAITARHILQRLLEQTLF